MTSLRNPIASLVPGRWLRARNFALLVLALLTFELWTACGKKASAGEDGGVSGRSLYAIHCTACHNANPAMDGSLGPAIKGSSLELIQARVLRAEYPAGYAAKRNTHIMPKLPLTEADVESLQVFLNAP